MMKYLEKILGVEFKVKLETAGSATISIDQSTAWYSFLSKKKKKKKWRGEQEELNKIMLQNA